MLIHFATTTNTGPVVAYTRHDGTATIVCECVTEAQAMREAARLNFECKAREALAARAAHPAHFGRRRARYFPDDE